MITHEQPTDPWKPVDFALLEAVQIIEQETCGGCGNPIWLCNSKDRDVIMTVRSRLCTGEQALEAHKNKNIKDAKDRKEGRKKSGEWGVNYFTVPELHPQAEREELPGRIEYLKEMAKQE